MGILDAYSPTQGTTFVELRAVTDSDGPVTATVRQRGRDCFLELPWLVRLEPAEVPEDSGCYFWRARLSRLATGTWYHVEVEQKGSDSRLCVETSTLTPPGGVRLMRFAILADMHLNQGTRQNTRRLREWAAELAESAIDRAVTEDGAEAIFFPGDLSDTKSPEDLELAQRVVSRSRVPIYVVTGNHDDPDCLASALGLPQRGYYSFDRAGLHFVMLSCPSELALPADSEQYRWLERDLEAHRHTDTFVFSHYAFLAHPFLQPATSARQFLTNGADVRRLLARFPRVRGVFAGHNNVPTFVESDGVAHLLCTQLIQGPCGYDIVDVYEGGFVRMVQEIDQQHLVKKAKDRVGAMAWSERVRPDHERNVSFAYTSGQQSPVRVASQAS